MRHRPECHSRGQVFWCLAVVVLLLTGCTARPWQAITSLGGDEEDGIGGTGIEDGEGIGGTGIIGVISDFGSIIVNGLRVELDNQTPVTIDGRRGAIDDLRRGQVVMVEASGPATSLNAQGITVRHEVIGPVTAVGPRQDELTVLDQQIVLASDLQGIATPVIGEWVAVSGFRAPNGAIYGTRIDRRDSADAISLRGRYELDETVTRLVRVAGQTVDGLPADLDLAGREVLLQGRLVDDRLVATQLIAQDEEPFDERVTGMSIAGFLDQRDGRGRLMGLPVTGLDSVPSLGHGHGDARGLGRPMIIEGRWLKDRRVFDVGRVGFRLDQRPPPGWTKNDDKGKGKGKNSNKGRGQGKTGSNKESSDSPGNSGGKGNSDRGGSSGGGKGGGKRGKP